MGHITRKLATAAGSALATMVLVVSPASAVTTTTTAGLYAGTATTPQARLLPNTDPWLLGAGPYLISSARTIYENSTYKAYTQHVCVTHRLLRWNPPQYTEVNGKLVIFPGKWVVDSSPVQRCGYISATGSAITDSGTSFNLYFGDGSYYSSDVIVTWRLNGPNGALLGQKRYNYKDGADYSLSAGTWRAYGYLDGQFGVMPM